MNGQIKIHPLNATGKYYVDQNTCLVCEDCFHAAPVNFSYGGEEYGYYVTKQPEIPEEEAQCKEAMMCCPMEAIYDNG